MAKRKKTTKKKSIKVESTRHKDKRTNIPTRELQDFVRDDEAAPKTMLYPRDPSLDPQLVWKGKDEQDREDLALPVVPVYIQEKIHPHAIIEDVRRAAQAGKPQQQLDLFSDFNGISFEQQIDFYHHEQNWANRMILGDSLLVMTSLAEKEGLKGKVQMIYFDPPYGIKFGSNWQVSTRNRDVKDGKVEDATREPEQIKAFRDTWQLGIHSYLAYLRDRLAAARELLTDTGSVFVQIGDENVHLVRAVMDEVLGSDNWIGQISVQKTTMATNVFLPLVSDYLLWYAKNRDMTKYRTLYQKKEVGKPGAMSYICVELPDGSRRSLDRSERQSPGRLPDGSRLYSPDNFTSASMGRQKGEGAACWFPVTFAGKTYRPYQRSRWKTNEEGMRRILAANRVVGMDKALRYVRYFDDFVAYPLHNLWTDVGGAADKAYVVETTPKVIERCLLMTTDPGDLVLDPTCGSGTTAYVAEQWGRRWITIDTSRVAVTLARTRLMAGRYPYHILSDSPEGVAKEAEIAGKMPPGCKTRGDIKRGFVYQRVPHITLKAIANNADIDSIHEKWQETLEPIRAKLNKSVKQKWEEWEIPREQEKGWPKGAAKLLKEWWRLRQERQQEIDQSIARNADTELLYDQPYEDNKRVRVSGPFTVESLSPHRVLAAEEDRPESEARAKREPGAEQFETTILDNLRKAGVQNRVRDERLVLDRLEPYAGEWIHGEGEYTEGAKSRRAAVSIGPEHATVGPEQVKEAAKEAVRGMGFDLLLVCGFAFDPHASEAAAEFAPAPPEKSDEFAVAEEVAQYGKLTVLLVKMNPDLAMGDELLKKTGAGNLFMIFGEPDIDIQKHKGGQLTVEVRGVDVYDPTTGQIRSNTTDDIACWFIDTDYNGESFFVRHAYFTGADQPYDKLKRALRAEIDEAAWAELYSTQSRPFDPPSTGKIAIKVINHYGDEVLNVYDV